MPVEPVFYGDTSDDLSGRTRAGDQTLLQSGAPDLTVVGDADGLSGFAVGGADTIAATATEVAEVEASSPPVRSAMSLKASLSAVAKSAVRPFESSV